MYFRVDKILQIILNSNEKKGKVSYIQYYISKIKINQVTTNLTNFTFIIL